MSDESVDGFRALRDERKEQHREWKQLNMEALHKHGLFGRVTNNGECVVFRYGYSRGRWLQADFYPSTGRWRSGGKTYSGGGEKFAAWWNDQMRAIPPQEHCPF